MSLTEVDDTASVQSQDNLIHLIRAEKYTPTQVYKLLSTALDDSRSFHFEQIFALPTVQALATSSTAESNEEDSETRLFLDLLGIFASGDLVSYLKRKQTFSNIMGTLPDKRELKLELICRRKLMRTLAKPDCFDFCEWLCLLDESFDLASSSSLGHALKLLELLAYDSFDSPLHKTLAREGKLEPVHLDKLRKASLMTLASKQKVLTYENIKVSFRTIWTVLFCLLVL